MLDHYYAVIMAGGGGTRLWPLSRQSCPKQMLSLFDDRSLFQTAVDRLEGVFPPENIYVVTVAQQAQALQNQCPSIPAENFLLEPMPRGTASVVGLAAVALQQRDPEGVMAVLTADHFIGNVERFQQLLEAAYEVAQAGSLVTLGIDPTFPSTGFGYIQSGEPVGTFRGLDVFQAKRFKEKPDAETAQVMLDSGDHSWNSGMFVWRVDQIAHELQRQMPDLWHSLEQISAAWGGETAQETVERLWPQLKNETIDYGIMEGAARVAVIPATGLNWNDVGSWDSLFEVLSPDEDGNIVVLGEHIGVDTANSLVYTNQPSRLIVTIGVDDLVVVDTGDVLMVCRKDQAQKVRQVVDQLKQNGQEYL